MDILFMKCYTYIDILYHIYQRRISYEEKIARNCSGFCYGIVASRLQLGCCIRRSCL